MQQYPLLVITGQTASGKSDLAMQLAHKYNGELICADSWTVYKGFDIGTAKPTAADRREVPHHLLDVADPREGYSAAVFQRQAYASMDAIAARGKLPILVGGTGLYIDAILYDYSFMPPSDPNARERYNAMSLADLLELAKQKGIATEHIDVRNKRRVIRAIENDGQTPTAKPLRSNTLVMGLHRDSDELLGRIHTRVDAMVAAGFVDEVAALGEQYGYDCEPMQAPGYRAFAAYVRGEISLEEAKFRFRQNDRKLAKKQATWFKRNKSIQWIDTPVDYAHIDELITTHLNKLP